MNRLLTLVSLVACAAGFAVAGPLLPSFPAACLDDTTLTYDVGVEKFQWKPQVAFDGTNYFAVWQDSRHDESSLFCIYGARLSGAGVLLDSVGIRIATLDQYTEYNPGVAFDGTNYLVVWEGVNPGAGNRDLYGARVTPSGTVLDPGGFLISNAEGNQFFANVAFNGSEYLAVWLDGRSGVSWLYCARVTTSGQVLDPDGIPICHRDNQSYPGGVGVAGCDSTWFIVADDCWGLTIAGALVTAGGTVAKVETLAYRPDDSRWFPDVDYSPSDSVYFVAWQDWRSGPPPEGNGIYGARVNRQGAVLNPGGFPIADDPSRYQGVPAVAWNGRHFMVAYIENLGAPTWYDIMGKRILPDGTIVDSLTPRHLGAAPWTDGFPALTAAGTGWFAAWEDSRGNMDEGWGTDIYGARIDSAGVALDIYPRDRILSASAPRQFKTKVAAHGSEYLAVWQEFRGNRMWDIYAARLDDAGGVIGQPFPVSADSHNVLDPAVAAGDSCWLVTWEDEYADNGQIWGRRIGFDGVPLGPGFVVSNGYINRYPVAAFDGGRFLVAYWEGNFPYEARGRMVGEDGSMGSKFVIASIGWRGGPGWNLHTSFGLAFDGANYLLVWPDWQESESQYEIKGARITPSGTVLDPGGFFVTRTPGKDEDYPRLAFGAGRFFAVWHDDTGDNLAGGRIDSSGTSLDTLGILISAAGNDQRNASVVFDGSNYFVAWDDARDDIADVYGARVTPSGTVLDPAGIPLAVAPWRQSYPGAASHAPGKVLVAYSTFLDTVYSASRMRVLTLSTSGIVTPPGPVPKHEVISACRPNPFSGATQLEYSLPAPVPVSVAVFDMAGRRVRALVSGVQPAGKHVLKWDGRDDRGRAVPAGVYSVESQAGDTRRSETIRLVR